MLILKKKKHSKSMTLILNKLEKERIKSKLSKMKKINIKTGINET